MATRRPSCSFRKEGRSRVSGPVDARMIDKLTQVRQTGVIGHSAGDLMNEASQMGGDGSAYISTTDNPNRSPMEMQALVTQCNQLLRFMLMPDPDKGTARTGIHRHVAANRRLAVSGSALDHTDPGTPPDGSRIRKPGKLSLRPALPFPQVLLRSHRPVTSRQLRSRSQTQ